MGGGAETKMNKLNELQKAYLAGLFDGEGCICVSKTQGVRNRTPIYTLQVVLSQTDITVLSEFHKATEIGSLHQKHAQRAGTSDSWDWRITTHDGADLLRELVPYLRVKQIQAKLAISFADSMGHEHLRGKGKGRGYTTPLDVVVERETYYQSLRIAKGFAGGSGRQPKSSL